MKEIDVKISNDSIGKLFFEKDTNNYGFNYTKESKPISLTMPYRNSTYVRKFKIHPIFDMNIPEGYLFEIFKNYLSKEYGYIDDYLVFSYLCANIESRITYDSWCDTDSFGSIDIDEVINNDTPDTFSKILNKFLNKNAISGVQPKSLALLEDKESLTTREYIVKTWGDEYPQLALNEYFCLKAVEATGVKIPNIKLSKNNNFLLVERFNYDKTNDSFLGFEEVLVLQGKNKDEKYSGSYESIAKLIYNVTTDKKQSMIDLFKTIVMSYLLKNGDAHLKNFGILYDKDIQKIWFAPSYDIVNTVVYIPKDRPALSMFGRRLWFGKKELVKFGINFCFFSEKESNDIYSQCIEALKNSCKNLEKYIEENKDFKEIGEKMLNTWKFSQEGVTHKEIPNETR